MKKSLKQWATLIAICMAGGTIFKLAYLRDVFYVAMQEAFGFTNTQFGLMMTAAQAKTFLVDVRTPSEIATTGKVEGALVANYSAPDFVDQFKALGAKPDDDIELYCRSGRRAEMASQILSKLGYKNIRNLGGYEAAAETLKRPLVK